MYSFVRILVSITFILCAVGLAQAEPTSDELLAERMAFWESQAALCKAGALTFPTKSTTDPAQPCDDGDMTMFNGLLCFAGDERGCQGVIDAQDPNTGQWFRSPRIRLLGHNDRGDASFSPDMALGVQLYLVKTGDTERAMKWAMWLTGLPHKDFPISWVNNFNWMTGYSIAWFCTEQVGCVVRPGDAASLAHTFDYLHDKKGMPILPDGSLRGTAASWAKWGWLFTWLSSNLNKPGYSQHLLGVEILLQRAISGDKEALKNEAINLASKPENEGNAFFSYLAGKDRAEVIRQTLDRCPSPANLPTPPLFQWQWERDNEVEPGKLPAWKQSCYWDCIFMGKLLGL
ncbi:hypothetical protein OIU34_21850 [Pararhizobium sp. BT-229]|uniref:hypothetical protein n=1 Tax=Pararhizobium sp. BT-229 TaxID=2986923 RepID=UPI0021F77837|nr:hypothetical protein [Pararhizobium sp. BT-229]MCV9964538.1 hypothetical protein [Pararhizobium sp. BT-229]